MPLHEFTPGTKRPLGLQPVNPIPVDSWSGPYSAIDGTTGSAITNALNNISPEVRFLSMEVRILARTGPGGATQAYKYWFRGNTGTLEEFSSGGGGIVGDYVTTFNGLTGAVTGVTLGGVNVWTNLNTFNAGITTSFLYASTGSTFGGTLQVNGGATFAGRVDIGGTLDVVGGAIFENTTDHGGVARFTAGITTNTIDVSGAARFNGGLTASAVDVTGLARFAGGISAAGATLGALTVNAAQAARLLGGVTTTNVTASGAITSSTAFNLLSPTLKFTVNALDGVSAEGPLLIGLGTTLSGRLDVGGVLDVVGGATFENTSDFVGIARFAGGISAAGATLGRLFVNGGLTATRVDTGTLASSGDATVGGTLSVEGNFYVAGTLTTRNETQLLIEDKYLVLGSTFAQTADGASGGLYLGSTGSSAIASFTYNDTLKSWDSSRNINLSGGTAYYIRGTEVLSGQTLGSGVVNSSLTRVGTLIAGTWNASVIGLTYGGTNKDLSTVGVSGGLVFKTSNSLDVLASAGSNGEYLRSNGADAAPSWASFSALTGITATSVNITDTTPGTYRITMIESSGFGAKIVYADAGITFDAATNTLSCEKLEAIVDGGTWV